MRRILPSPFLFDVSMEIDYATLLSDVNDGTLRDKLEAELIRGFEEIRAEGEALPPPSHYASRIAEIISRSLPSPLPKEISYDLYQEVLIACERARATVLGQPVPHEPSSERRPS